MTDFATPEVGETGPTSEQNEEGTKRRAKFFAAVRERGMLNAMMQSQDIIFEAAHPDLATRWEFWPPNGDNTMVVARESIGYRLVDASELPGATESSQKSGPIRRGDLVLMAAPLDIHNALLAQDAKLALEDLKAPETTYREALNRNTVASRSGTTEKATPVGSIRRTTELKTPKVSQTGDIEIPELSG